MLFFIITTNPGPTFLVSCCRLSTSLSLQYQGKWYNYPTKSLDKLPIKVGKSEQNFNILYWPRFRPLLNCFDFFISYRDTLQKYHLAKKPNFFLIELIFFQVDK